MDVQKLFAASLAHLITLFLAMNLTAQNITWEQISIPPSEEIAVLAINDSGHVFAGSVNIGMLRSIDGGDTWTLQNSGLTPPSVFSIVFKHGGQVFAGTGSHGGVFRSIDNGETWAPINNGLASFAVLAFALNANGDIFAATSSTIFRTVDNGDSWIRIETGLPDPSIHTRYESLVITANGDIFVGTNEAHATGGIFLSTDNGDSWTKTSFLLQGLRGSTIFALARNSASDIFAGTNCRENPLYRSQDGGAGWNPINSGLTSTTFNLITVFDITFNSNEELFLGTFQGVFHSSDNGENWSDLNSTLSDTDVRSLVVDSKGRLFAGTRSGNLFRSTEFLTFVEWNQAYVPLEFGVEQNYPNPFNPETTIEYRISKRGPVVIRIYNLLGQEIVTLVNEERAVGNYRVSWAGKDSFGRPVSSGIYIYRMKAEDFVASKKLIFIR